VESSPARLTIARTLPEDAGQRQVYVSLDGERIATLYNGEAVSREIPPGSHTVRLNNTLVWKTIHLDLKPGEHAEYQIANKAGRMVLPFLAVMGVAPLYLIVKKL